MEPQLPVCTEVYGKVHRRAFPVTKHNHFLAVTPAPSCCGPTVPAAREKNVRGALFRQYTDGKISDIA